MTQPRTYVVSGAGSGIGRAVAQRLAADNENSSIVLVGRTPESLEETRSLLPHPAHHLVVTADVRHAGRLREEFARVDLASRNVCGVVANAGAGGMNAYGEQDRWDEIISTNLHGTYYFINETLPALRRGSPKYRGIVVISSILARIGVPGLTAASASKAGLLGLVRSLAAQVAPEKILVNAVAPGWVDTPLARSLISEFAQYSGATSEQVRAQQLQSMPLGKMSEPMEVAALVSFLLSDQQTSCTGQTFDLNNGASMP